MLQEVVRIVPVPVGHSSGILITLGLFDWNIVPTFYSSYKSTFLSHNIGADFNRSLFSSPNESTEEFQTNNGT